MMGATREDMVWIGNYGRYNEGFLVGGWLRLPFDEDALPRFLEDTVRVDGAHEEWGVFDASLDGPLGDLGVDVAETADLLALNALAEIARDAGDEAVAKVAALREAAELGPLECCAALLEADDLPVVELPGDARDFASEAERLGRALVEREGPRPRDLGRQALIDYLDAEGYGADLAADEVALGPRGFIFGADVPELALDEDGLLELSDELGARPSWNGPEAAEIARGFSPETIRRDIDAFGEDVVLAAANIVHRADDRAVDAGRLYADSFLRGDYGPVEFAAAVAMAPDTGYTEFAVSEGTVHERLARTLCDAGGDAALESNFDYAKYGEESMRDFSVSGDWAVGLEELDGFDFSGMTVAEARSRAGFEGPPPASHLDVERWFEAADAALMREAVRWPACFGWQYRVSDFGDYVTEEAWDSVLPTPLDSDRYIALSNGLEPAEAAAHWRDAGWMEAAANRSVEMDDAVVFGTEAGPWDFTDEEIAQLESERPELFDGPAARAEDPERPAADAAPVDQPAEASPSPRRGMRL